MSADKTLKNLVRYNWLIDSPLESVVSSYIQELRSQRYTERTIRIYLGCLAHFGFWLKAGELELAHVDVSLIKRFLHEHLPACTCPAPCYDTAASSGGAVRHLLRMLLYSRPLIAKAQDPVKVELSQFNEYLTETCGLAPATRDSRTKHVTAFLTHVYGTNHPSISQLSTTDIDSFFAAQSSRLRPASLRTVCNSLRSYFRYRAVRGDSTDGLAAAIPRIADWRRATLPKVLSDAELAAFLNAFDRADPVPARLCHRPLFA